MDGIEVESASVITDAGYCGDAETYDDTLQRRRPQRKYRATLVLICREEDLEHLRTIIRRGPQ